MKSEFSIVKAFLIYKTWEKHSPLLSAKDFPEEIQFLYRVLDTFHQTNEQHVDLHLLDLANLFFSQTKKDKEFYEGVFDTLDTYVPNEESVRQLIMSLKRARLLREASITAYEVAEGKKDYQQWEKLLAGFNEEASEADAEEEDEFVTTDLHSLLKSTYQTPGLRWRLDSLNKSLGSLRKGTFGIIQARPETGKTTFCASEFTNMALQIPDGKGPVLFFNNEQEGEAVMMYMYRAALGITLEQVLSNTNKWDTEYNNQIGTKLRVYDSALISKQQIESLCKKYKPSLIVVDQLDKIKGFKADREDLVLGEVYQWAREMAKQYAPFVGVCQAGATAHNKKWLDMADMNNSKTSKAAECDFILGVGKIEDTGWEKVRFLNLSKNKCLGDEDTDPAKRHNKWEVLIEPERARYNDI